MVTFLLFIASIAGAVFTTSRLIARRWRRRPNKAIRVAALISVVIAISAEIFVLQLRSPTVSDAALPWMLLLEMVAALPFVSLAEWLTIDLASSELRLDCSLFSTFLGATIVGEVVNHSLAPRMAAPPRLDISGDLSLLAGVGVWMLIRWLRGAYRSRVWGATVSSRVDR